MGQSHDVDNFRLQLLFRWDVTDLGEQTIMNAASIRDPVDHALLIVIVRISPDDCRLDSEDSAVKFAAHCLGVTPDDRADGGLQASC